MQLNKVQSIVLFSIGICLLLYMGEQILRLSYFITTPIKIVCFLGLPILWRKRFGRNHEIQTGWKALKPSGLSLVLGLLSGVILWMAYVYLSPLLDFNRISDELILKSHITPTIFVWIGLYITIGNAFLEEYFFRGFIYFELLRFGHKGFGMIFSALLFALYHLSIFTTWFDGPLLLLALFGLFAIGLVYNAVNDRSRSIGSSWVMHMMADAVIVVIGMKMFGLLT